MPNVLDEATVDNVAEQIANDLVEEREAFAKFAPSAGGVDLSNGGTIGGVRLRPVGPDGRLPSHRAAQTPGRPVVRRAWMWNGTESTLPLAYTPDGKRHDGAMHYLLKRHCLCCHNGGFMGSHCPNCAKNNCEQCRGGTDTQTEQRLDSGKTVRGWIVPNFYLHKEDVPFPAKFYGSIDCFLSFCPRSKGRGFLTAQDMRMHARSRHRLEYQAFIESQTAAGTDTLDQLRAQVAILMANQVHQRLPAADAKPKRDNMAAARAQRAANVAARAAAK